MMNIPKIKFGKKLYCEDEGGEVVVYSYADVSTVDFDMYMSELETVGFCIYNEFIHGTENKAVYLQKADTAVYAMYYPSVKKMRIVYEPESEYLNFNDTPRSENVKSLLTQLELEDYGQSSIIRLSDGRFIIFDGGWDFEPDADSLMRCLHEQATTEKPIVAAWIMTHPDVDHYRCCITFTEKYADEVIVERFIYNFPDADEANIKRVPALESSDNLNKINELNDCVKKYGAQLIRPHTGQIYTFSNAKLEVLSSPDDCFTVPVSCFNYISLVIKMTIEDQVILWCGDANFKIAELAERWGAYLKSDILQIPHHGFDGGQKEEYTLIDPKTCLLTGNEETYFGLMGIYYPENLYLIYDLNVRDWYMNGQGTYTLELPYVPRSSGRKQLFDKVEHQHKMAGAYSWFFDDVTSTDCDFVFINATSAKARVYAELYFENAADFVSHIKIEVNGSCRKHINLLDTTAVDPDALFYNPHSLKKKGIKADMPFAVQFKSNIPIVIKGSKPAIYYF